MEQTRETNRFPCKSVTMYLGVEILKAAIEQTNGIFKGE